LHYSSDFPFLPELEKITKNGDLRRRLLIPPDCQTTLEAGAWLKTENLHEIEFTDQAVNCRLPVFFLNLGQNQLGGIGVVKSAKIRLHLKQLMRPFQGHLKA
jgi:hypothetical protein